MADPRRLYDAKDMEGAILYAKRVASSDDAWPLLVNPDGSLIVSLTSGTISVSTSTKVTLDNVLFDSAGNLLVNMTVGTISLSTTAVTVTNDSGNPVPVSLSSTIVTATLISGQTTIAGNSGAVSATTPRVVQANDAGKTFTGATGTISATWTSIYTPTNKAKVYALSFTTTSASEVTVIIADGVFANAKEKWRYTLMAPSGSSAGANLSVSPPASLFSSRSTSALTISLSTAVLVHYSLSFFDEV